MEFLEKLNRLMERDKLNKNTLSKSCKIPYTTIDGWYKKGYEGLKLTTLRRLADFFGTTLDFWVEGSDKNNYQADFGDEAVQLIKKYNSLSSKDKMLIKNLIDALAEK